MKLRRRDLLRGGSVAALGGLSLSCAQLGGLDTGPAAPAVAAATGAARWADGDGAPPARVRVAADRVIRTIVGLRPFRASGFRLEVERLGEKLLVHNYGHGGAGITFSWGTSELAAEMGVAAASETGLASGWSDADAQAAVGSARACAVMGCGVMGLSTAILMQRRGWHATIYAKAVPPHTTSNVAGGFWGPHAVADPERAPSGFYGTFVEAARLAHRAFQRLVGDDYGVRWIDNYTVSNGPQPQPWFEAGTENLYPAARALAPGEYPFPRAHAFAYRTLMIEPHHYLNALMRDFRLAGGRIVARDFGTMRDVAVLGEPLIFNCTGLGAKELVGDDDMDPIRGQLTFLLPQPEVDYTVISGDLYMFPRSDGILLGGTHERGNWSLEPDPETVSRMLDGHRELFGWGGGPAAGNS